MRTYSEERREGKEGDGERRDGMDCMHVAMSSTCNDLCKLLSNTL